MTLRRIALVVCASTIASLAAAAPALAKTPAPSDTAVPLVTVAEVTTSPNLRVLPDGSIAPVASKQESRAAATTTCGWANTKINLKGGVSGLTVAWHAIRTDWCWNGTSVVGTPTGNDPTFDITAYGWGLGYSWTTEPRITNRQWVTQPTKYRIQEAGTLAICPLHVNIGCFGFTQPYIRHDMDYRGMVGKAYGY
jgi:hypothetical protein